MNLIQYLSNGLQLFRPFVERELREQYAGSLLGIAWSILQPLLFILLYWWVFAAIMRVKFPANSALADTPFIVFLLSALLPWFAIQEGLIRAAGAIVNRRDVVRKVHFSVQMFPLAAATAAFVIHASNFLLFLIALSWWRGELPIMKWLGVLLLLGLQFCMTVGLGLLLAAITVYLRDVQQILNLSLTVLFYTAPILYPLTQVPSEFYNLIHLNPFTVFAEAYHNVILAGIWPSFLVLIGLSIESGIILIIGIWVFRRLEPGFADIL